MVPAFRLRLEPLGARLLYWVPGLGRGISAEPPDPRGSGSADSVEAAGPGKQAPGTPKEDILVWPFTFT